MCTVALLAATLKLSMTDAEIEPLLSAAVGAETEAPTNAADPESEVIQLREEILSTLSQVSEATTKQIAPVKLARTGKITVKAHLDFIAHAANLRAKTYRLPLITLTEIAKQIGYIQPTAAAIDSVAAGSAVIELYKFV
jgi:hypothetical protein